MFKVAEAEAASVEAVTSREATDTKAKRLEEELEATGKLTVELQDQARLMRGWGNEQDAALAAAQETIEYLKKQALENSEESTRNLTALGEELKVCYHATMLPCYHATMLLCYHDTMLPCYHAAMLSRYYATMLLCYHAAMLSRYAASTALVYLPYRI